MPFFTSKNMFNFVLFLEKNEKRIQISQKPKKWGFTLNLGKSVQKVNFKKKNHVFYQNLILPFVTLQNSCNFGLLQEKLTKKCQKLVKNLEK